MSTGTKGRAGTSTKGRRAGKTAPGKATPAERTGRKGAEAFWTKAQWKGLERIGSACKALGDLDGVRVATLGFLHQGEADAADIGRRLGTSDGLVEAGLKDLAEAKLIKSRQASGTTYHTLTKAGQDAWGMFSQQLGGG